MWYRVWTFSEHREKKKKQLKTLFCILRRMFSGYIVQLGLLPLPSPDFREHKVIETSPPPHPRTAWPSPSRLYSVTDCGAGEDAVIVFRRLQHRSVAGNGRYKEPGRGRGLNSNENCKACSKVQRQKPGDSVWSIRGQYGRKYCAGAELKGWNSFSFTSVDQCDESIVIYFILLFWTWYISLVTHMWH